VVLVRRLSAVAVELELFVIFAVELKFVVVVIVVLEFVVSYHSHFSSN
jgi:hypothetical protein